MNSFLPFLKESSIKLFWNIRWVDEWMNEWMCPSSCTPWQLKNKMPLASDTMEHPWLWSHTDADSNPAVCQLHLLSKLPHLLILGFLIYETGIPLRPRSFGMRIKLSHRPGTWLRRQKLLQRVYPLPHSTFHVTPSKPAFTMAPWQTTPCRKANG